jgi:pimeloyl-ACP methyl ester carboxylesterase
LAALGAFYCAVLPACTVSIDEGTVFAPRKLEPIDGQAPNGGLWREDALARTGETNFTARSSVNGEVSDFAYKKGELPPSSVFHGFLGEASGQIAYTLVTRQPVSGARPLIVHCGGNAADRWSTGLGYAFKAIAFGDVLLFDYPGYGDSGGAPSAASFEAMNEAIAAFRDEAFAGREVVYWGHSLGGFVCAELAGADGVASGMIFEMSAPNARETAQAWTPALLKPFVRIKIDDSLIDYDSAEALANFKGRVLVLAGKKDKTLPPRLSRSLAARLEAHGVFVSYVELEDAGHTNAASSKDFRLAVGGFFAGLAATPNAAGANR